MYNRQREENIMSKVFAYRIYVLILLLAHPFLRFTRIRTLFVDVLLAITMTPERVLRFFRNWAQRIVENKSDKNWRLGDNGEVAHS